MVSFYCGIDSRCRSSIIHRLMGFFSWRGCAVALLLSMNVPFQTSTLCSKNSDVIDGLLPTLHLGHWKCTLITIWFLFHVLIVLKTIFYKVVLHCKTHFLHALKTCSFVPPFNHWTPLRGKDAKTSMYFPGWSRAPRLAMPGFSLVAPFYLPQTMDAVPLHTAAPPNTEWIKLVQHAALKPTSRLLPGSHTAHLFVNSPIR